MTSQQPERETHRIEAYDASFYDIVVIGASAGGVHALETLLVRLPRPFPVAICIVLHLSPDYESLLAPILTRATGQAVRWATNGAPLLPGAIYVAPPNHHMVITTRGWVSLTSTPRENYSRPSVDQLLSSAAKAFGDRTLAVVLTGSGGDGTAGSLAVQRAGGVVIAQDEESSQYFSMPHEVILSGAATMVLPLPSIAPEITRLVKYGTAPIADLPPVPPNVDSRSPIDRGSPPGNDVESRSCGS